MTCDPANHHRQRNAYKRIICNKCELNAIGESSTTR